MDEGTDVGLAAERTDIAWSRTGLALAACGAAVLRQVPSMSNATNLALVAVLGLMLAATSLLARRRIAAHERDPAIALTRVRLAHFAITASFTGALCLAVTLLTIG